MSSYTNSGVKDDSILDDKVEPAENSAPFEIRSTSSPFEDRIVYHVFL